MLTPEALLRHARRLVATATDEADLRRAISAAYYAVFDFLITRAAETQAGASLPVQDSIRRSIEHGDVRRVCTAIAARPGARPAALQKLLAEPVSPDLILVATTFVELNDQRISADYDLGQTPSLSFAEARANLAIDMAQAVLDTWPTLSSDPNTRTLLFAVLFYSRWTRRP